MTESSMHYPGWRVVIACFAMTFFGFGYGFYGHSVYLAALTIRDGTDSPRLAVSTVSTAVTIYYLAAATIMVFISDLIVRIGPRLFATIGAVMMGVSLLLIARFRSDRGLPRDGASLCHADECRGRQHPRAMVHSEARTCPVDCAYGRRCRWADHRPDACVAEQQALVCDRTRRHCRPYNSRPVIGNCALHPRPDCRRGEGGRTWGWPKDKSPDADPPAGPC